MSADRQRLTSAIRRIAKTDPEIRGLLDAADNKGGKPGAAGVGGGLANKEGDNIVNETRICCDGSVGEPNPGVDERNPDDGGQTELDPDDPADTDQGPGTLDGVTDCATGEQVCFDGAGFVPPDNWDAPDDPPLDPEYEEGVYFKVLVNGMGVYYFQTCTQVGAFLDSTCDTRVSFDNGCADGFSNNSTYCSIGGDDVSYTNQKLSCSGSYNAICDEPPPTLEFWPDDGCVNLVVKGGTIVGSKYDPENDGSYSAPRDSIDLCDGSGNQISLAPAANGGWKTINSTTDNGYLYNSSGKQIAHIDGNEYSDPSV